MLLMEKMGDQQLFWRRGESVTVSGGLILVSTTRVFGRFSSPVQRKNVRLQKFLNM